jgi:hypothetical protein
MAKVNLNGGEPVFLEQIDETGRTERQRQLKAADPPCPAGQGLSVKRKNEPGNGDFPQKMWRSRIGFLVAARL